VRFEQHGPQAEKPVKIAICEYRRSKSFENLCAGTIPINGSQEDSTFTGKEFDGPLRMD
jgi:hypothetical protein